MLIWPDPECGVIVPRHVHLVGTLEEGIKAAVDYSGRVMREAGFSEDYLDTTGETIEDDIVPDSVSGIDEVVSLVLYLCSERPDITGSDGFPSRPEPVKTKKGYRYFPPKKPAIWETGFRLGEFLRETRENREHREGGGTSPSPHVRRAHWHTYWTGPKKVQNKRKPVRKWIPPTPVGFDWEKGAEGVVPVVKRVRD